MMGVCYFALDHHTTQLALLNNGQQLHDQIGSDDRLCDSKERK
jgi:hypothetical protein